MKVQSFAAKLLSPLSYRTRPDSGAGGASVTGKFLGDIALAYAIEYARYGGESLWDGRSKTKPRYVDDFKVMNHRCTVGIPTGIVSMMPIEYQATSFVSEGYPDLKRLKSSASSSMKNWMQMQSIAPFNEFEFMVISRNEGLPANFTVRLGNGRETLAHLVEKRVAPKHVTVNAYTVEKLLGRRLPTHLSIQWEHARYILAHGVQLKDAVEALRW